MSTPKTILSTLGGVENAVTIAIELAGNLGLVPLIKGTVQEIRQIATGGKTITYSLLVATDSAELDAVDKLSQDDLAAINAELQKYGVPPVPIPPAPSESSSS